MRQLSISEKRSDQNITTKQLISGSRELWAVSTPKRLHHYLNRLQMQMTTAIVTDRKTPSERIGVWGTVTTHATKKLLRAVSSQVIWLSELSADGSS